MVIYSIFKLALIAFGRQLLNKNFNLPRKLLMHDYTNTREKGPCVTIKA